MKLEDMVCSEKIWLRPEDVAEVEGCNPQSIRVRAREGTLPYKYVRHGNRTLILRASFLEFMTLKGA